MSTTKKDPVLVVFQLTGANDYLNTVIPYTDPNYRDARPRVGIPEDKVIPIDDELAFNPQMAPMKKLFDEGKMAIVHGIGYENSPRSPLPLHGYLAYLRARQTRDGRLGRQGHPRLGPGGRERPEGHQLRARAAPGRWPCGECRLPPSQTWSPTGCSPTCPVSPATSSGAQILDRFARMYSPAIGTGAVMDYLGQTGRDALKGADILRVAPERYSSSIEYADTPIAKNLKSIAQVHMADLGTQLFYTQHGSFDTHFNQTPMHTKLWIDTSRAISDFFDDLKEHDAGDNLVMMIFTEFGRRVRDNGTGTDHGAGGVAFVIGDQVKGGHYSTYPSLKPEDLQSGDLAPNYELPRLLLHNGRQVAGTGPGAGRWRSVRAA